MKRRKLPKSLGRGNIIFYAVLLLAVLSLIVVFVAFRDEIDNRTLDNFLDFLRLGGKTAEAREISFDAGLGNLFALGGDYLGVLSPARMALYDRGAKEVFSRSVSFENPALIAAGDKLLVFDRRNPHGFVLDGGEAVLEMDFSVLTASGNTRGEYVLATQESGYRAVAAFYNDKDQLTYKWLSSSYITAVALSPSGKRMLSASAVQRGTELSAELTFLEVGNTEPLSRVVLPNDALVLNAYYPDNSHVCILTENGVYFYTDDGAPLGEYRFDGEMHLGFYPTEKALFLHLGPWTNKRYGRLLCLGYEGSQNGSYALPDAPDEIRAYGKVCAVLQDGRMTEIYASGGSLTQRAHWETGAVGMLLKDEDTMLLMYHNKAVWNLMN